VRDGGLVHALLGRESNLSDMSALRFKRQPNGRVSNGHDQYSIIDIDRGRDN
jgi:hypothetical protein